MADKKDGLDKLSQLVRRGNSSTPEDIREEEEEEEARTVEEIDGVLRYVGSRTRPEGDIFEMQALIEAAAEELRNQIREMAEEEG
jgi:hypothetical protein